jgi:hypothetical protein
VELIPEGKWRASAIDGSLPSPCVCIMDEPAPESGTRQRGAVMAMKRLGFLLAIGCLVVGAGQALAIVQSEDAHVFDIAIPETPPIVDPAGIPGATATIDEMTARYGGTW